ncbi:MAG: NAD-dependent epimerase/dehydratase family protein [Acidobacteriota bacterium]
MKFVVTGAAGFIGSHLCERLLAEGNVVIGVDSFSDYYSPIIKEKNIKSILGNKNFLFLRGKMEEMEIEKILKGCDGVFHLAAQPGVRKSWGLDFEVYVRTNVLLTQKILEVLKNIPVKKFIYASSSSVYGNAGIPFRENSELKPVSPYGVTKLAGENLCFLYFENFKIPVISLRYFTVYGPRQRPDMGFHKFFLSILDGREIEVYGDGNQSRDFTYIDDVINGTISSYYYGVAGEVYNIGGGTNIRLNSIFPLFENITGRKIRIKYLKEVSGDVRHTQADYLKAQRDLKFKPNGKLEDGLEKQWKWMLEVYGD